MLKGFKDFLLRGNVVDLAVAVVIGAAFTSVVTAFTNAFLKPLIQLFSGGGEFAGKIVVNDVEFDYATFINSTITFVITAGVVYFLVVAPMKWLVERRRRGEEDGPAESTDVELLTEIRDLLQAQAEAAHTGTGRNGATAPNEERTARMPPQDEGLLPVAQQPVAQQPVAQQPVAQPVAQQAGARRPAPQWADEQGYGYRRPEHHDRGYDEAPDRRPAARPRRPRSRHADPSDAPRH